MAVSYTHLTLPENLTELVFLVNSKDTRFDERAVLRPLLNS